MKCAQDFPVRLGTTAEKVIDTLGGREEFCSKLWEPSELLIRKGVDTMTPVAVTIRLRRRRAQSWRTPVPRSHARHRHQLTQTQVFDLVAGRPW